MTYHIETMKHAYPVIDNQHLADNPIWNIPSGKDSVRGEIKHYGPWQIPVSYRALTIDSHKRVFGVRTLTNIPLGCNELEGRVSIEGKKYRAFTSSQMFERADGSLIDVAVIYACDTPDMLYVDPLTVEDLHARLDYVTALNSKYFYERQGTYYELKEYCNALRALTQIALGTFEYNYPHVKSMYEDSAREYRALIAPKMRWSVER